ncbi:MAG: ABC-2 transporter permease [Eubacteriales bacterium]|nr:ABC-2 transporter permease [Eubacteriales bacterium]
MKGLLQKDMELLRGNLKVFAGIYLIAVFLLITSGKDNAEFFVSYVTMISGILVLNTISYDDMDKGMMFIFTLPVTRNEYVKEKYVFGILAGMGGWIMALVLGTLWNISQNRTISMGEWLIACFPGVLIIVFILTVLIPLQLKFGSENSRLVMIIAMAGCAGVVAVIVAVIKKLGVDTAGMIAKINAMSLPVLGLIVALICVACLVVSAGISTRIIYKKEF